MLKRYRAKSHIKELTDAEISAAIRYLESGSGDERRGDTNTSITLTYVSLMLLLSIVAFTCLYYRIG